MLDNKDKMTKTGDLGERLVAHYFRQLGHNVQESLHLFDNKKDMMIDNETVEVKTQQPWHREDAFTVKKNQLRKCKNVDRLIFVETPSIENGNVVNIWEFPKDKRDVLIKNTNDGREMCLYLKRRANLIVKVEENFIVDQFKNYSISKWKSYGKKK